MSSLLAWLDVRAHNGALIFRLEDLDPDRSFEEYANLMAEDLNWLGLSWDEGWFPSSSNIYMQSNRTAQYEEVFEDLKSKGLIYPCYCSRSQRLAASAPHPGEPHDSSCPCRYLTIHKQKELQAKGRKPAWKLIVPDETIHFEDRHYGSQSFELKELGDFIIRRSDGIFAYQLAVSYDDYDMRISSIVRAHDLLSSAARQIYLIRLLGGTEPSYSHCPLLVTSDGRKLSKREGDLNMESLRKNHTKEEILGYLAFRAGLIDRPEDVSANDLISIFSWDKICKDNIDISDFH